MMRSAFVVDSPTGASLRALNYTPEVERLRRRRGSDAVLLDDLLAELGAAYGSVFVRVDCERDHGVELITQGDMFAAEPTGRVIRADSMARPERHRVRRWQVLIAGAGTLGENELYGRAIMADRRLEGSYVGPHAMVLTFREPESDQALFTYAFLLTATGLRAIRAASFGTKILGLRKDLLRSLPIPIPNAETTRRVSSLIRRAVESREIYLRELCMAREILARLPEVQEAHAMCSRREARAVTWSGPMPTLRAWNFASTGDALSRLRRSWPRRLRDCLEPDGLFKGGRLARVACSAPHGVDLLSQRDVFAIRPVPRRIQRPSDTALGVDERMLLLASRGQMNEGALFGRVERAAHMPPAAIVSEDITRLHPRSNTLPGLLAFLSSTVGQALLRSTAYGTSIPGMRMDLLEDVPVPSEGVLRLCAEPVQRSTDARIAAAAAESEAIRIVEEEVLPAWLA